jgi:MoaA/NifB/PqqE/SkfB family radical SAM enzyme
LSKLEDIGFYTLSDKRCSQVSETSPMSYCELILTTRCNFRCPYCRGPQPGCHNDMHDGVAVRTLYQWCRDGLKSVRFTGGEPLLYRDLARLVCRASEWGCDRIAVSSNGSFPLSRYTALIDHGVNDFSISLDADCETLGDEMAGVPGTWKQVVSNIREIARRVYTVASVVVTIRNQERVCNIIKFAHDLGVADIRLIPITQASERGDGLAGVPASVLAAHPTLRYRVDALLAGRPIRGISDDDTNRCYFPLDDSVVCGGYHFPCAIYMREGGEPIGQVGVNMRAERAAWGKTHDTHTDPICRTYCRDFCIAHNNKCAICQ